MEPIPHTPDPIDMPSIPNTPAADGTAMPISDEAERLKAERLKQQALQWVALEEAQNFLAQMTRLHDNDKAYDAGQVRDQALKFLAPPEAAVASLSAVSLMDDYWGYIDRRKESVPTGLHGLDELLNGGLEAKRLYVLLGAPGGGKTTLANQIAAQVADAGCPALYVTSEDTPFTLLAKTLARLGPLEYNTILKGTEREQINRAIQIYRGRPGAGRLHYLDASYMTLSADDLRQQASAHFKRFPQAGQRLLVVDYLQRLARMQETYSSGRMDLRQSVSLLTERLRSLAVELDCSVLALASQHRASGYGVGGNVLASAKESGDIEYTADVIMAIGNDEERSTGHAFLSAKILPLEKNRQGHTGRIALDWDADRQQFLEVAQKSQ